MRFKNCRPSLLGLPDGRFIMAGAEFDMDPEHLKNPAMQKWAAAGWFKPAAESPSPAPPAYVHPKRQKKVAPEAAPALAPEAWTPPADAVAVIVVGSGGGGGGSPAPDPKAEKFAAIATAEAADLLKFAEGESDPEIMDAINARAHQLVGPA